MGISNKFLVLLAVVCALAIAPVALGSGGAAATATPSHVKAGKLVELKITGLKAGERIRATEVIPAAGDQKRTLYPKQRASSGGVILVSVKAQVKGRHNWTFVGRQSHRKATTHYVVR
jgi:hypothetical protein